MKRLSLLLLVVLLVGCIGLGPAACPEDAKICPDGSTVERVGPTCEFEECPVATPTPEPTPDIIVTPTPDLSAYTPSIVGESVERGDFLVGIVSVGKYPHTSPFGEERVDYRVDMNVKNIASTAKEYRLGYHLFTDDEFYPIQWYSTLDDQGFLGVNEEVSGYVIYDIGDELGPFQLYIQSLDVRAFDTVDVIGINELDKPVAGGRMYATTCGANVLGEAHLGSLFGSGACDYVSAARDLYVYPSWVNDGVVIHRLKLKNSAEEGVNVLVIDEIPEYLGVTVHDLAYGKEPIFLDDYHPAWLIHLSRNEIWKIDMNYTIFLDDVQIGELDPPVVLTVEA